MSSYIRTLECRHSFLCLSLISLYSKPIMYLTSPPWTDIYGVFQHLNQGCTMKISNLKIMTRTQAESEPDPRMQNTTVISYYVCEMLPLFTAPVEDSALVFKPLRGQLWPLSRASPSMPSLCHCPQPWNSLVPFQYPLPRFQTPAGRGQSLDPLWAGTRVWTIRDDIIPI